MDKPRAKPKAYERKKAEILAKADINIEKRSVKGPLVLNWEIHYGSMVFFSGKRFQEIYEHSVTPLEYRFGQVLRHVIGPGAKWDDGGMSEQITAKLGSLEAAHAAD